MTTLLAIAIICMPPVPEIILEDRVDVLEVNHVAIGGSTPLDQIIGWDWIAEHNRYDVVFWRIADASNLPKPHGDEYVSEWREGWRCPGIRRVFAAERWERWLDFDIERRDREVLPASQRRKLSELRAP